MYDDGFFSTFVSTAQPVKPEPADHRRRTSLLLQPEEPNQADDGLALPDDVQVDPAPPSAPGPPQATIARRAQSYADFYHVVKAQLDQDADVHLARPRRVSLQQSSAYPSELGLWDESGDEGSVDEELLDASNDRYELYLEQQRLAKSHLDLLIADTDANLKLLADLSASFASVEAQTSAFRSRCESLLSEQKRMAGLADGISQNLQYYNYLDPMTRRLNAPGAINLARSDEFHEMLANLDRCLEYMETHPKQKEAPTYQARYKLLLTRGLTLIRVNFTNTVREIAADVAKRIADRQLNDTTMPALLYAKFRVGAPELKQLTLEIQKRANPPADAEPGTLGEYEGLMSEMYQSYAAARGRLIVPIVRRKMAEMDVSASTSKDLVAFVRTSVSYMRGLCLDEFELWHEWFEGDGGLYEFLDSMCEPLYDYLRPRTIRETQLPKLCEVCSLLQARYMADPDDESPADEMPVQSLDFGRLIRPALEDAQTRLVFLAQTVLRDDIERFRPKPDDVDYPARNHVNNNARAAGAKKGPALSGRKNSLGPLSMPKAPSVVEQDETSQHELKLQYDNEAAYQGWYPTLKRAIWLLSRIYRLVNSTVFDDLAHQIVHQTSLSLHAASSQIKTKASAVDAQLFLLKQLLILKQQIVAFDIEFVTPELNLDFSSMTSTFWELRERGGLFNPSNLMRLVSMPRVVENMLDAKADLDVRLRNVINDFVGGVAGKMTAALADGAPKQSGATAVQAVRGAIEREVRTLRSKLEEYMDDGRTRETLVGAVQDQALANYEAWFEKQAGGPQGNGASVAAVSRKGKGKEDEVWDPDTFADWTVEVFGVGRLEAAGGGAGGGGGDDDEQRSLASSPGQSS